MSRNASKAGLIAGGLTGAAAVATGAFGAHGLRALLEAGGQATNWETASRYALAHAAALVGTGLIAAAPGAAAAGRAPAAAVWCFALGTAIFSGCLWGLAVTGIRVLGAVVPIGGGLLIVGWLLLALSGARLAADTRPPTSH